MLWCLGGEGEFNDEIVHFYSELEKFTGATRKELKKEMDALRSEGLVILIRGLIAEDRSGYFGSGFMLTGDGQRAAPKEKLHE